MDIRILPLDPAKTKPLPTGELGFGSQFSNRMFTERYTPDRGWHGATIGPYEPFVLDPSTAVFHYAQEIFEGTKAYRRPDGDINLFRTLDNVRRFNASAERMAMPPVDEHEHLEAITRLVELEHEWVPDPPGALYIRPAMIATDPALGVHSSRTYLHFVIVGPAGAYFRTGFTPVAVYISDRYRRAVKGGVGGAKTGGNYAASLAVGAEAAAKGYAQVLWLDGIEGRYVEEVGAMNICFVREGRQIVTPALTGTILDGITRRSVLALGPTLGYDVVEEALDVGAVLADIDAGRITEAFGCGTAAVIAPVNRFGFRGRDHQIGDGGVGPVSQRLYDELTGLQYGSRPDPFGWTTRIAVPKTAASRA